MAELPDTSIETEEGKGTQQQNTTQQQKDKKTNLQVQQEKLDVTKVKDEAVAEYLKSLGVESDEVLKGIVTKHKEDEEANKTELQKSNDTLTATTKELAAERELRIMAEAKLSAIELGAKPELVEDLVVVAKSKVTKDKDINAVIAEIKESASGKIYFADEQEEEEKGKNKTTVTRKRVTKEEETKKEQKSTQNKTDEEHNGTMAERLLANRKARKSHYFK